MIAVIIPMIAVITRGAMEAATRLDLAVRKTGVALERAVARGSILLSRETRLQLRGKGEDDPFLGRKGAPAPFLGSRSGFAAGRITPGGRVFRSGNMVFSVVGSPDRYVKFHEEGGTISGNQFLRIQLKWDPQKLVAGDCPAFFMKLDISVRATNYAKNHISRSEHPPTRRDTPGGESRPTSKKWCRRPLATQEWIILALAPKL